MVGQCGFGEHARNFARRKDFIQRLDVVEFNDVGRRGWIEGRPNIALTRARHTIAKDHNRLIDRAVIAAVKHQNSVSAGNITCQA